jgi:small-conductance mechanosensitive channel
MSLATYRFSWVLDGGTMLFPPILRDCLISHEKGIPMSYLFLGNTIIDWVGAVLVTIAGATGAFVVAKYLCRRLTRIAVTSNTFVDDALASALGRTRITLLIVAGFYFGSQLLELTPRQEVFVNRAAIVALIIQMALWGDAAIRQWLVFCLEKARRDNAASTTSTAAIGFIARTAVWTVAVLMVLDNLGFNIATLVASLGIGGIAVALAVQNILSDLFASLSIVLDKPFVVGDFVIVGEELGTVEFIGLKTTRVRGLGGDQIVFSNAEMLKSRIHNQQRMVERRQSFVFRVSYDTTAEQLRRIAPMVREAIESHKQVRFDRAHFRSYGESALEFEAVYFMLTPDYNLMMDYQQEINLTIFERLARDGVAFGVPRREVFVNNIEAMGGSTRDRGAPDTAMGAQNKIRH